MFCLNQFSAGNTNFFTGNVDELAFFNNDLTSTQMAEIVNGGTPNDLLIHSPVGNLVSYLRMGERSAFDGTNFTFVDQKGTNNAKSNNMAFSAKVSDTP